METPEGSNRKRSRDVGDPGRCSKQSSKRAYDSKKKRIFAGNRYTKIKKDGGTPVSVIKIKRVKKRKTFNVEGYRFVDIQILEDMVSTLCCPECYEKNLYLEEDAIKKKGLAVYLSIVCPCGYIKEGYTSKAVDETHTLKQGMKPFEVNTRMVYALRTCGLGHAALEKFCCIINMPKPMTKINFDKITNKIRDSAKVVAEISMNNAATELKKQSQDIDC